MNYSINSYDANQYLCIIIFHFNAVNRTFGVPHVLVFTGAPLGGINVCELLYTALSVCLTLLSMSTPGLNRLYIIELTWMRQLNHMEYYLGVRVITF